MKLEAKIIIGLLAVLIAVVGIGVARMGGQPAPQSHAPIPQPTEITDAPPSKAELLAIYQIALAKYEGILKLEQEAAEQLATLESLSNPDPQAIATIQASLDAIRARLSAANTEKELALRRANR